MQLSPNTRVPLVPTTWHFAQRVILFGFTVLLAATMLLALSGATALHARQTPNRRDRRADREVPIRYPRTQPQNNSGQGSAATLQSAPPTPQSSTTPNTQNPSSSRD